MTNSHLNGAYTAYLTSHDINALLDVVTRYCRMVTDDEDAAQEAAIRVWRNLDKYDAQKASFAHWVRVIAQNRQRTLVMQQRPMDTLDDPSHPIQLAAPSAEEVEQARLHREATEHKFDLVVNQIDNPYLRLTLRVAAKCADGQIFKAARLCGYKNSSIEYQLRKLQRKSGMPQVLVTDES